MGCALSDALGSHPQTIEMHVFQIPKSHIWEITFKIGILALLSSPVPRIVYRPGMGGDPLCILGDVGANYHFIKVLLLKISKILYISTM